MIGENVTTSDVILEVEDEEKIYVTTNLQEIDILSIVNNQKAYIELERWTKAEREFNRKAGFTNEDDRLAKFFYEEPLPPHNTVVVISDEEMDSTFDF